MPACPKCEGRGWFEIVDQALWTRCLCGYAKLEATIVNNQLIIHRPKVSMASLPRTGTKMHDCLIAVKSYYPEPTSTGRVSMHVGVSVSEASAYLSKLSSRGLVAKYEQGQGKEGGSSWVLTYGAECQLKLRRQ